MSGTPRIIQARGTGWVLTQLILMSALLVVVLLHRGHWTTPWTWFPGVALLAVGAWAGIRGKYDLGRNLTPFPRPKEGARLITTGIYAQMRHPLYLAVMTLGFAWALLWRSWPALVLALVQALFLDAKARHEERCLRRHFEGYDAYARGVKRFLPGLY